MYRVLLVEDELLVRMGLKNSIDWGKYDMQIVADAADGRTAYELFEKLKPDLIITDLNMPIMSGMELISKIREKDTNVKIVILTCMEEFELARKAVSLGVSDYIVKHMMTEEQIQQVLAGVYKDLSANKLRKASYEMSEANTGIIKEKLIKNVVLYGRYSEHELAAFSEKLTLRLKGPKMIACVVEISHYSKIKSPIARDTLLNMLNDALTYYGNGEAVFDDDTRFILIFGYEQKTDDTIVLRDVFSILHEIESSIKGLFNASVSFGLSNTGFEYSQLHEMYLQALDSLEDKFIGGVGIYGYLIPLNREKAINDKTEELVKLCENASNHSVGFFTEYFSRIRLIVKDGNIAKSEYLQQFCKLVQWAASANKIPGEGNEQITASAVSAMEAIQQSETLDETFKCLYDFFSLVSAVSRKKRITSREVRQAVDYIEANYGSNLSLQQIADQVRLSPNYLSSLFRKEIETSFTGYLTEVRIEKAKELLLETYLKTYEIAECVGFNENAYFCKIFKKETGKTPSEFRRQWRVSCAEDPEDEGR